MYYIYIYISTHVTCIELLPGQPINWEEFQISDMQRTCPCNKNYKFKGNFGFIQMMVTGLRGLSTLHGKDREGITADEEKEIQ